MKLKCVLWAAWASSSEAWTVQDRQQQALPLSVRQPRQHHPTSHGLLPPPSLVHPSTEPLLTAGRKRGYASSTRRATSISAPERATATAGRQHEGEDPWARARGGIISTVLPRTPLATHRSSTYHNGAFHDDSDDASSSITSTRRHSSSPGLTREQEVSWTFCIRRFRAAVRMRDQLARQRGGRPPSEAEWASYSGMSVMELRKAMQQGQQAREALVSANVGLVTSIAKRHYQALRRSSSTLRPTLADLIQEGNVGILSAAERYQPEKGFRFSTYATWWIRQRIVRSISDGSRIIRLPAHVQSTLTRMHKAKRDLKARLGRDPDPTELATELDISVEKLQRYTDSSRDVVSLEVPLRKSSSSSSQPDRRTLLDVLASDAPTPEEDAQSNYLRRDIQAVMENELAEKERHVISHRFGLVDGKPRSHAETAKILGISRDRVRLVEARALNKLRSPQRNYRLKEYVSSSTTSTATATATATASRATSRTIVSKWDGAPPPTSVFGATPATPITGPSAAATTVVGEEDEGDDATSPWPASTPSSPGTGRIWFF